MSANYFFLKNTSSYDRAVAIVKFLQTESRGMFDSSIKSFVAQTLYRNYDHLVINKEVRAGSWEQSFINAKNAYFQNMATLWPDVECYIINDPSKCFFYLYMTNLECYEFLEEFIINNKVIPIKQIPCPASEQIFSNFYLKSVFFTPKSVDVNEEGVRAVSPSIDWRAQQQIKIILQQQMLQKNSKISHTDIIKINAMVDEHTQFALIGKIKQALLKSEGVTIESRHASI